jgi:hypothetical protein
VGDLQRVEAIVRAQLTASKPAFPVRQVNGELVVIYPILVLVGRPA